MRRSNIMARGNKQLPGQLSFDFCLDTRNYVVQANSLVGGKQALKLNSAKLIRAAIMQVVRDDEELKPYIITVAELAELLNVPKSNIYRDIEDITNDILSNPVYVRREDNTKKIRWIKIPWVQRCEYNSDIGVAIKLNDELKPFLLNLKEHYTQYTLDCVLAMKSVYTIRIYELLQSKIMTKLIPKDGTFVEIPLDELKECCGCESKSYNTFANFRIKVLDKAVNEINAKSMYRVKYDYVKRGKSVVAINFHVNMMYHDF
jgi:plasmid replication initiation protein